jgi:hypothetical protein
VRTDFEARLGLVDEAPYQATVIIRIHSVGGLICLMARKRRPICSFVPSSMNGVRRDVSVTVAAMDWRSQTSDISQNRAAICNQGRHESHTRRRDGA